ncbi:MAG: hypothetical protein J5482_03925 [Oscillospiraceae bacterium]|nr:hypothetical protein [Oscillospiraceae bacterium]
MKKLWIRLGAGLLTAVVAVAAVMLLSNTADNGKRTDGLFYQATGIHPDARLITVDGEPVTAEEYFYWLAYGCEYLSAYMESADWNDSLTDDMSYSEYAKSDSLEAAKLFALVRIMAKQNGVTLTQEDLDDLKAQRDEYIAYYGDEETYLQQIALVGINEEMFDRINSQYYLLDHLSELSVTEGSSLYPAEDELLAYAQAKNYVTARLLFLSTSGLSEEAAADQQALAEDYLAQLRQQSDADAAYDLLGKMVQDLGMELPEGDVTFGNDDTQDTLLQAVLALDEGAVSDVIETSNGFYIAIRRPLNKTAVAKSYYNDHLSSARQNAKVVTTRAYEDIDAGAFFTTLMKLRNELADSFTAES